MRDGAGGEAERRGVRGLPNGRGPREADCGRGRDATLTERRTDGHAWERPRPLASAWAARKGRERAEGGPSGQQSGEARLTDRRDGPRRPQAGPRPGHPVLGGGASPLGGPDASASGRRPGA